MRAARLHELGGVPRVEEIDPPESPSPIAVSAAALNPVDVSIATGRFYGGSPPTPYVIGSEAVGTTLAGGRVWTRGRSMLAEQAVAGPWSFEIPAGVSDELALGCGIAGLTAWLALAWRAPVRPADTVLVLGASGVLGGTAVQAAKLLGAARVIGAARRIDLVPDAADERVELSTGAELPEATLILDTLWGEPFERALAAAAPGVRVIQLGQSAGPASTLLSAWVRGKQATILGHPLFDVPEEVAREGFSALCTHAAEGRIRFRTDRYPLAELAQAWARQVGGSEGAKIVVGLER
jgi:NADPH2:quinone reductase